MINPKPVINPVHNYTLDGRLREGNTYLERSALGVSLDSGLTEGASCLEPLEQSVLSCIMEKVSDWKPVINPVQDITPDGRPMEGTAYPEHSALGVSLDSGLREGMLSLELLQQSVLNTSLVARHEAGIMTSDWKPVINPVQDITPDGRPMEGTAYPEHSALDSGLRAGMSSIEPVRQSFLIRCRSHDRKQDRRREGNTFPEHSALGVSLDSGLMEGNTRAVTRPDGGSRKEFANWDAAAHPVPDINLDGRPMEGNTYLESLGSGVVSGQWTHGGDVASGTIGAVSARSVEPRTVTF